MTRSPEREATFRRWWTENVPVVEIGQRLGVSKSAISDWARRLDLPKRELPQSSRDAMGRARMLLTPEQAASAFTRWANGEEIYGLATAHEVSYEAMRRVLRRNPAFKAVAARRRASNSPWPARDAELRQKRAEGKSRAQIAAEMGLTENQVKDRLACIDAPLPVVSPEERAQRAKEAQRLRDAQRKGKPRKRSPRKPVVRVVAPAPPALPALESPAFPPFPPRRPGTHYPPVQRPWAEIQRLAAAEAWDVDSLNDLGEWNKARVRRGDAPVCIWRFNQDKAA